jgi:acetyltransferase-like isoleucine patch superfamily enzyme
MSEVEEIDPERTTIRPAVHALLPIEADPEHEIQLSVHLRTTMTEAQIAALYVRFLSGLESFDGMMRRVVWRALARKFGDSVRIAAQSIFRHLERVSIGSGVFIGEAAFIQGHVHGNCRIGDKAWIGPQAFLDARALILEESVSLGPGAKILTSSHSGLPAELPVNATDQVTRLVCIGAGADIGVGAVVLPGCRVGRGAIVGAGAVVTKDVPNFAVVAGAPARLIRFRGAQGCPKGS